MEKDKELFEIISDLLLKGYEGGYWDYKSDYPATGEDKLHDIICMANNLEDRDAYLIYGANDDGTVCGIENSSKRCVTADFIKFLRDKNFAGGFIPQVEMHTLKIGGHEIDVLVILRGNHTPYYLQNDFGKDPQIVNVSGQVPFIRELRILIPQEIRQQVLNIPNICGENISDMI